MKKPLQAGAFSRLAERVGFEPTVRLHARLISSQVHSTTLPPLLNCTGARWRLAGVAHDTGPARAKQPIRRSGYTGLPQPIARTSMSTISAPVSYGELIDKVTILEIKSERIADAAKLANVRAELDLLNATWAAHAASHGDIAAERGQLRAVNEALWDIEDRIRMKEKAKAFDVEFIELARSVYIRNDERAAVKRAINEKLGSTLVEEKSYQNYR